MPSPFALRTLVRDARTWWTERSVPPSEPSEGWVQAQSEMHEEVLRVLQYLVAKGSGLQYEQVMASAGLRHWLLHQVQQVSASTPEWLQILALIGTKKLARNWLGLVTEPVPQIPLPLDSLVPMEPAGELTEIDIPVPVPVILFDTETAPGVEEEAEPTEVIRTVDTEQLQPEAESVTEAVTVIKKSRKRTPTPHPLAESKRTKKPKIETDTEIKTDTAIETNETVSPAPKPKSPRIRKPKRTDVPTETLSEREEDLR